MCICYWFVSFWFSKGLQHLGFNCTCVCNMHSLYSKVQCLSLTIQEYFVQSQLFFFFLVYFVKIIE